MSSQLIVIPVNSIQRNIFNDAVYLIRHITPLNTPLLAGENPIPLPAETEWQITTRQSTTRKLAVVWLNSEPFDDVDVNEIFGCSGYINIQSIAWLILPNGKDFIVSGNFDSPPHFLGIYGDFLFVQVIEKIYCLSLSNNLRITQTFTLSQQLGIYKSACISRTDTSIVLHVGYLLLTDVDYSDSVTTASAPITWETFDLVLTPVA